MALEIVRGIEPSAWGGLIYGDPGIGKTTLATQFPGALVLDTEDGAGRVNCAKVKCRKYVTLHGALIDLAKDAQGFQTVIIDSVDWAERLLKNSLSDKIGKPLDDLPYGRGTTMLAEAFATFLAAADVLVSRGVNVLMVGHSTVKRCTPPDMEEGFDRYELKLSKQVGPLVKEWADFVIYAKFKTKVVEGADGKNRGRGGKERVLCTEHCAAWDAKNRFGLPAELPMTIEALAPLFADVPKPAAIKAKAKPGWLDRAREAETVAELGEIETEADQAVTAGDMTESQRNRLAAEVNKRHAELDPAGAALAAEMGIS